MALMKAKNQPVFGILLLSLAFALVACGTTTVAGTTTTPCTTATAGATAPDSATAPASVAGTAPNPFAEAVRALPTSLPSSVETIVVELDGESWVLPAAVCLRNGADAEIVLEAAKQQVATVHGLVRIMISGWPSTTWGAIQTEEEMAVWRRNLWTAGVSALTLAGLVGQQPALEQAWVDYEQSFADPAQGWGPPTQISGRLEQWKAGARALTEAIGAFCSTK
jgi:hypothetical protein